MTAATLEPALRAKLSKLVALLGSPVESEAVGALHGLARVLEAHGMDFNDLSVMITGLHYAEPEEVPDPVDDEPEPTAFDPWGHTLPANSQEWLSLVGELVDGKCWRGDREERFLYGVLDWTMSGREPSGDQKRWILDIRARSRPGRARGP